MSSPGSTTSSPGSEDPRWYRRYGLDVLSEIPFGVAVPASATKRPDLSVTRGPLVEDPGLLDGETLAELENPAGRVLYTLVKDVCGYTLRVYGVADFRIDAALSRVSCRRWVDAPPGVAEIVLQASVLAFVLTLRGRSVLHASAVSAGSSTFALAGPSGSGKSTFAALLCASGAVLVADDLVCVEGSCVVGTGPGAELRLREGMRSVVEQFESRPPGADTADGRLAILPRSAGDGPLPLGGVLFPTLATGAEMLHAERVQGAETVIELVRCARISGWRDPEQQRRFFEAMLELAENVPAWRVQVPSAHPLVRVTPDALVAALAST